MLRSQSIVLEKHRALDSTIRLEKERTFISGWQTENPLADRYLSIESLLKNAAGCAHSYEFLSDSDTLVGSIKAFHRAFDGVAYSDQEIFPAPGSSPLLMATMAMLKRRDIFNVYYIPPIYYTFYYWAHMFGIKMTPLCNHALIEYSDPLPLPPTREVLIFSDPIWIMGHPVPEKYIDQIAKWQNDTGSLAVIDGTFQYTKWRREEKSEHTARLDRSSTLRLVCPTKSLGVHGVRFAYMLLPPGYREDIRYPSSNGAGASDAFNLAGARRLMYILNGINANSDFVAYIKERHARLHGRLYDDLVVNPSATYYVFGRLRADISRCHAMTAEYFELSNQDFRIRINILIPGTELKKLAGEDDVASQLAGII